jgi:hypothetical protein
MKQNAECRIQINNTQHRMPDRMVMSTVALTIEHMYCMEALNIMGRVMLNNVSFKIRLPLGDSFL